MSYRRLAYLFGLLALVSSGAYLFVYLYRWEWNRALMAGVFFIAAELALVAAAILERIKSVENRIAELGRRDQDDVLDRLQENAPPPKDRFAWLSEESEQLNVFIPFLMGAGLVASGIAWMVERVAGATAKPVLERRLALRLQPLAMPGGGMTGIPAEPVPLPGPRFTLRRQLAALALAVLVGTVGFDLLADATKTRPDVLREGSRSVVTVELRANGSVKDLQAARSLWGSCLGTVPNHLREGGLRAAGPRTYTLELEPALGKNGERRLRGCLSDATLDNIVGRVVSVESLAP